MPNEETSPSLKSPEAKGRESLLSFRDFLKAKGDELGVRDRHRRRGEWLGAIHRLLDQIRDWLRESDPEDVLDIEPYDCQFAEYLYRFRGIFCWKGRRFQGEGGDATTSGGIMAG